MKRELISKYNKLKNYLLQLEEVTIAYSGGVDSALLLKVAKDTLGDKVTAILGKSESMPDSEYEDAIFHAREIGVRPEIIKTQEIDSPDYCNNPVNRCYVCKKHIFGSFKEYMRERGLINLLDGSNYDDRKDYEHGAKALKYHNVLSPLEELKITKENIRELSFELGLPTWNKEAMACLATRIANNDAITIEKFRKIDKAEEYLRGLNFTMVRARLQGNTLRIEVNPIEVQRFFELEIRQAVLQEMKNIGFKNISIDMEGYKMGSMNTGVNS